MAQSKPQKYQFPIHQGQGLNNQGQDQGLDSKGQILSTWTSLENNKTATDH